MSILCRISKNAVGNSQFFCGIDNCTTVYNVFDNLLCQISAGKCEFDIMVWMMGTKVFPNSENLLTHLLTNINTINKKFLEPFSKAFKNLVKSIFSAKVKILPWKCTKYKVLLVD